MNKASLVDAVYEKIGGTKVQAEQAVDTVVDSIVSSLKKGDEVSIAGLGIFSTKQRAARTARSRHVSPGFSGVRVAVDSRFRYSAPGAFRASMLAP